MVVFTLPHLVYSQRPLGLMKQNKIDIRVIFLLFEIHHITSYLVRLEN